MREALLKAVRNNASFFIPILLYLIVGLSLNLLFTQRELFFAINDRHTIWQDTVMVYYTWLGDGILFGSIILIMFFVRLRLGIAGLVSWGVESVIVQVCKLVLFEDRPRPWKTWREDIYVIEGFDPYINNSFPSGHTASAFCLFALLAMYFSRRHLGWLFFILAFTVGYSRIYLAQHYFIDTYIGAIIGTLSALLVYAYFYRGYPGDHRLGQRLDRPLHKLTR